jgi:hypothetical protein
MEIGINYCIKEKCKNKRRQVWLENCVWAAKSFLQMKSCTEDQYVTCTWGQALFNVGGMHRGYHGVCTLKFLGFHGAENKNPLKCWKVFNSKHRKQGLYFDLCFVASWNLFSPFPFLIVPKNSRHMVWMELITSCLWEWALTGLSQTAPHL